MENIQKQLQLLSQKEEQLLEYKKQFYGATRLCYSDNSNWGDSIEFSRYQSEFENIQKEKRHYEKVLASSELVTDFDCEKVDIGTTFEIQFENQEKYHYTLVESNVGISSIDGYITIASPLGRALLGKRIGEHFQFKIGNIHQKGTVLQLEVKENVTSSLHQEKEPSIVQEDQKSFTESLHDSFEDTTIRKYQNPLEAITFPSLRGVSNPRSYFKTELKTKRFASYFNKVKSSSSFGFGKDEWYRLHCLSASQKEYLYLYLKELVKRYEQPFSCINEKVAYRQKIAILQRVLTKDVMVPRNSHRAEMGQNILCEMKLQKETKFVEGELISGIYADEYLHGFLSIRQTLGFYAYRMRLDETAEIGRDHINLRLVQFGIQRNQLLYPLSANLHWTHYTEEEKKANLYHERLQRQGFHKMTASQKELFQRELQKTSHIKVAGAYVRHLYKVQDEMKKGKILSITDEEIEMNQDKIGLGSRVSYVLLQDKNVEVKEAEFIECAYTVEDKNHFIEMHSPLGKALLGKQQNDSFTIKYPDKEVTGYIQSVNNLTSKSLEEKKFVRK